MKRFGFAFLVSLISVLAACQTSTPPEPETVSTEELTATAVPAPTSEPTAETPASLPPQVVTITAQDGLGIYGTFYPTAEAESPAVLLMHMYRRWRGDWRPFQEELQKVGFASLAIDLRGHGETGTTQNWERARQDSLTAIQFLREQPGVDPERIAVLGASIGGNLALHAGADDSGVRAVVALSPGLDYFRVTIEGVMDRYGNRSVLLVASEDDSSSVQTVRRLADEAQGEAVTQLYQQAGHGTDMFGREEPDLATLIVNFLEAHLR